jgi:cholesterol transport system auxiliary component
VNVPRAAAGYNSNRMVYVRQALTQEAYTRSVWVDTPARMLAPLLVNHLQQSGLFRAVLQAPSGAQADLRLDTTVVRLQQDFLQLPSRVHVEWQLSLMNTSKREVLAWHHIHVVRLAPSDDAAGGAQAGNAATQEALRQATDFLQTAMAALPPLAHKD